MAFCCRRTSFKSVEDYDAFSETASGHIIALRSCAPALLFDGLSLNLVLKF